ncbi:hypothetical protein GCM10010193_07090 [Kitasatospora atroaurantiaca]
MASALRRTGPHTGAALVQMVATPLATDTADAAVAPWADAAMHLLVTLELHQEARSGRARTQDSRPRCSSWCPQDASADARHHHDQVLQRHRRLLLPRPT